MFGELLSAGARFVALVLPFFINKRVGKSEANSTIKVNHKRARVATGGKQRQRTKGTAM